MSEDGTKGWKEKEKCVEEGREEGTQEGGKVLVLLRHEGDHCLSCCLACPWLPSVESESYSS